MKTVVLPDKSQAGMDFFLVGGGLWKEQIKWESDIGWTDVQALVP